MNRTNHLRVVVVSAALAVAVAASGPAVAEDTCCFTNFRFAGGCIIIPSGSETCTSILAYLNNFDSVGRSYCDNTTIRGGWSQVECGTAMDNRPQALTPEAPQQAPPVQQQRRRVQPVDPRTAPRAQDANLMQVSSPLQVRFDEPIDAATAGAGQTITGRLANDLVDGDTVVAPAGSMVQAQLVPTSYWTSGEGDAFSVHATAIAVGDSMLPLRASAVATSSTRLEVLEGTLVSFVVDTAGSSAEDEASLRSATAAWMTTWNDRDAAAHAALYAEDAVLLPPNQPAVFGREAIRATVAEEMAAGGTVEVEDLEVVVAGSHAYKAGRYRVSNSEGELLDRGKYIEIWTHTDGEWLIHRDIWNSSLAESLEHDQE